MATLRLSEPRLQDPAPALPGGRQFLFYAQGTPETVGIYLGSVDSGETRRLTPADY